MNKTIFFSIAAVAALFITSCNENPVMSDFLPEGTPCELNVSVASSRTKAVSAQIKEEKINNLQIFIFREDGSLDGYEYGTGNNLKVLCTAGSGRQVYAVVNGENLSSVSTRSQLLASVSKLSHNKLESFEMVGNTDTLTISKDNTTIPVSVSRIAARVEVSTISNKMRSAAYQADSIEIVAMYLTNVAPTASFDFTATPKESDYFNKMKFVSSAVDSLVSETFSKTKIAYGDSLAAAHFLYAYPNPSDDTTSGGTWSRRCTRLVIEAKVGGVKYYYPINLPALEHNKSYKISNLTITKPGSDNPDEPVSTYECTFNLTVDGWTSVDVTGTTI